MLRIGELGSSVEAMLQRLGIGGLWSRDSGRDTALLPRPSSLTKMAPCSEFLLPPFQLLISHQGHQITCTEVSHLSPLRRGISKRNTHLVPTES